MAKIIIEVQTSDTANLGEVWAWLEEQLDQNYAPDGVESIDMRGE